MAKSLEQVREGQVPAELAGLFVDVRHTLRVTYVPLLFRALAARRPAARTLWRALKPNLQTRAFEEAADDLRAHVATAAVDLGTPLVEPVLLAEGLDVDELDEIRGQVDLFHYVDAKLLLTAAYLERLLEGHVTGGARVPPPLLLPLPRPLPEEMPELVLLPEEPGGVLGEIFHEVMAETHLPTATVDLRVLGRWPVFMEVAWREVRGVFRHRDLARAVERLEGEAEEAAALLPHRVDPAEPELRAALDAVADVVPLFADAMPRLALFAAVLKVALDGAQDALDSPFPVDWESLTVDDQPGL